MLGHTILRSVLVLGLAGMTIYPAVAAETSGPLGQGAQKLDTLFKSIDADQSGTITMKEYMAYHNLKVTPQYSEYFEFRAMDADDSQTVSKTELRNATDPFDPKL